MLLVGSGAHLSRAWDLSFRLLLKWDPGIWEHHMLGILILPEKEAAWVAEGIPWGSSSLAPAHCERVISSTQMRSTAGGRAEGGHTLSGCGFGAGFGCLGFQVPPLSSCTPG